MALPLDGVRILDMTVVWAGPFATQFLSDLGAEIIRVESLQHADVNGRGEIRVPRGLGARRNSGFPDGDPGERPWERGASFNNHSRNKKSVTMDLSRPKGREMFLRLVAVSDAFIENNSADVMQKLGLTYDALSAVNPRFVMISMPGFGNWGRYRHFKGYGGNTEAVVGHTGLRGYTDMDYNGATRSLHSDAAGGASAAFAVLSALHYARRTGKGQYIEMAQAENVAQHLTQALMDYSMNRRVAETMGNRDHYMAPNGVYPCQGDDKWIAISVTSDAEWKAMTQIMGQPELATDVRFADGLSRHAHQDELDTIIAAWTPGHTHYEVMEKLQAVGIAAGPVLNQAELLDDPHLNARGFFQEVTGPATGTHRYVGPLYKLSKTPLRIRSAAPTLGQHNEYVYKEILKVSDEEYEELVREEHIGDLYIELKREREREPVAGGH